MGILKDSRGVKVPTLPAKKSNLPAASQLLQRTTASCTSTLAAVYAIRRPSPSAHSFMLRFGESEVSSAMRDTEIHHEQPINRHHTFLFTGGEL
jgi:hypothetical protein